MADAIPASAKGPSSKANGSEQSVSQNGANQSPAISLPKGGGAIKGISEKFSANPVTGTSSFSIALPFSPARGFEPQLSVNYDSGAGNSPFGLGWSLSLPSISRKTDKGLPQYLDQEDSDTYIIAGAEDLIPLLKEHLGNWQEVTAEIEFAGTQWEVKLYRPRTEGAFAKIERWRNLDTGVIWWRTTSGNNVTSVFGYDQSARIADPANPAKIFKWLLDCSYDDKGHFTKYVYKKEDMAGIDHGLAHELHRKTTPVSQSYLKRVLYGIKRPYWLLYEHIDEALQKPFAQDDFHFQTVFDYGEHIDVAPNAPKTSTWEVRHDPFSEYRAGFEVRTYRRCKRVISFHQFENEFPMVPTLPKGCEPVSEIAFTYENQSGTFSLLTNITSTGYKRDKVGVLQSRSLPPMTFGYQAHAWNNEVKIIDNESLHNIPSGVDGSSYRWADLYQEGISGVLSEQAGGLYYKQNMGGATFAEAKLVSPAPSIRGLANGFANGAVQIQDLAGNGFTNIVSFSGPVKGFYKLDDHENWQNFQPFNAIPNIDFQDPNLRVIDLNGDGKADLLISEDHVFRWYPSAGEEGYSEARTTSKATDEDAGPTVVFANGAESIFLADMSGDGMTDIVRIRNGSVVYWPNKGYGQFAAKISMGQAPHFNHPDQFDPRHIRLADLDGSGPTDIIYLGQNEFRYWLNQNGNSWSTPYSTINPFPRIDNLSTVSVIDLLGTGTACVVWSSPLPEHSGSSIRYVDLMASTKPHLMTNYQNGMGKEVTLSYTPSTQFYLEDKQKGEPWITKLHFPVHCLSKVQSFDRITKARFSSSYSYHHGYYDHAEREFRGFGRVDQIDTENYEHFVKGESSNVVERVLHQTPILSKTWFHNGYYLDKDHILSQFQHEYFSTALLENYTLKEPELPQDLSAAEWREALRACKGLALRSEVYGLDGSTQELIPYSIAQKSCEIKRIQPKANDRYASFQVIESESLSLQLDRNPDDPRISHNLVLQTDAYGNPLLSAAVAYPRLIKDTTLPVHVLNEQEINHIIISQAAYTDDQYGILGDYDLDRDINKAHLLPVAWKSTSYEVIATDPKQQQLFSRDNLIEEFNNATSVEYQEFNAGANSKRALTISETRFINNTLNGERPAGEISPLALSWQSYQLAFTPSLLQSIFGNKVDSSAIEGGYVDLNNDGNWWRPSGTPIYKSNTQSVANRFYSPEGASDPFGHPSWVDLDEYLMLPIRSRDNKQNESIAFNDYRTLQAQFMRDVNHNWSAVEVDELGLVIKSAIMGKVNGLAEGEPPAFDAVTEGDNLAYPTAEMSYYDPTTDQPAYAYSKSYVKHHTVDPAEQRADFLQQVEYSDGGGNVVMVKAQAEPGLAKQRNADGTIEVVDTGNKVRWIGNGRTILNNKGNPVKQYEPYFSVTRKYEDDPDLVEVGITPILFYDAAGRNNCKLNPNKTYEKVVFNPWKQMSWDVNDTLFIQNEDGSKDLNPANDSHVGHYFAQLDDNEYLPSWYAARIDGELGAEQQNAAVNTESHANTPAQVFTDALGRTIYALADNADKGKIKTRTVLDIEGNSIAVIDDRDNIVMAYAYNMLPPPDKENPKPTLYQNSMDGGEKWTLLNVLGNPLRSWDSRDHVFESHYDELNRPTTSTVFEDGIVKTIALAVYQDSDSANADITRANNLIGAPYESYDQAGLTEALMLDFKGNSIRARRTFATEYKQTINWSATNPRSLLQEEYFETTVEFDALGRVIHSQSPHNDNIPASASWLIYNESGALNSVDVTIREGQKKRYVLNMDYDAKGQRQKIEYGNKVVTEYDYEPDTYRLKQLVTKNKSNEKLQDLNYVYDPVGNISEIRDNAQQDIYFKNTIIEPLFKYQYDAVYQLIEATGREHNSQAGYPDPKAGWDAVPHPNTDTEMQNYTQSYEYDGVGNITKMAHRAYLADSSNSGGWTRHYQYETNNNRLTATKMGKPDLPFPDKYTYNQHGSMTSMMPNLPEPTPGSPSMDWDYAEQLRHVDLNGGGNAWYVYDASGERTRKIIETIGSTVKERIYLGGWEIYRVTINGQIQLGRETQHVMDDKSRVALIETKTVDNKITIPTPIPVDRYQLGNHLGSASVELSDAGDIISYEEFHPYGTTAYHAGTSVVKESAKRYRYTGMERDEETRLSYHNARYYIAWLGRWCSSDPSQLVDGPNVYIYSGNHPSIAVDRTGLKEGFYDERPTIAELTIEEDRWGWVGIQILASGLPEDTIAHSILKSGAIFASNVGAGTQNIITAITNPALVAKNTVASGVIGQAIQGMRQAEEGSTRGEVLAAGLKKASASVVNQAIAPGKMLFSELYSVTNLVPNLLSLGYHIVTGHSPPTPYTFVFGERTLNKETMNTVESIGTTAGFALFANQALNTTSYVPNTKIGRTISNQKQARHLPNRFDKNKGFVQSQEHAQTIIDDYHGGMVRVLEADPINSKVAVWNPRISGTYVGRNGTIIEQSNFFEIKGKNVTVYPKNPRGIANMDWWVRPPELANFSNIALGLSITLGLHSKRD